MKIENEDRNGHFTVWEAPTIELGDPIDFFRNLNMSISYSMMKSHLELLKFPCPPDMLDRILKRRAYAEWEETYKEAMNRFVPEDLFALLKTEKKSDQLKLLKGIRLNSSILETFYMKAYLDYGFLFSNYSFNHNPTGIKEQAMPRFAYKKDDGTMHRTFSPLSDGQIRSVIEQRHLLVAKFLDNGNLWHCFFGTMRGMIGGENGGEPHYHYISSGFGRSREDVLFELSQKNYKLPKMPHIPMDRYK